MPMLSVGQTKQARMWVYVGDQAHPYNVFDFTLSRGRDGPKQFLKDYQEVLLADAYGGYNGVVAGNQITRAGCWAHARRKFIDAEQVAPEIAREAVELLRALYAVEKEAKDVSAAERLEIRQARSAPILIGPPSYAGLRRRPVSVPASLEKNSRHGHTYLTCESVPPLSLILQGQGFGLPPTALRR